MIRSKMPAFLGGVSSAEFGGHADRLEIFKTLTPWSRIKVDWQTPRDFCILAILRIGFSALPDRTSSFENSCYNCVKFQTGHPRLEIASLPCRISRLICSLLSIVISRRTRLRATFIEKSLYQEPDRHNLAGQRILDLLMPANLTFEQLRQDVSDGKIDTVLTCIVDMQGRLMGKRFHAAHFIDGAYEETHGCDYLLATDLEMIPVPGFAAASWEKGYGDYTHKPDLTTLRRVPWLEGTAMVMCDVLDHHTHAEVPHAPRTVLKRQIARARALGFSPMMATELEFFLFEESFDALHDRRYADLRTLGRYNADYALQLTSKEEDVMRAIRNGLYGAGIPVENSKGEAEAGQEEINIRYSDALDTADMHAIVKTACKEIANEQGRAVTFMAKYADGKAGSSSHIHQSLFKDGEPAFFDDSADHCMSQTMRSYLAGLITHAAPCTAFLAPYINSYKRFTEGLFAPTRAVWSTDNRTAGFRVCAPGTKAVRAECRIGGADLNPYMALAGQLAAGLDGIEKGLELEAEIRGDIYQAEKARHIPHSLRDAADALDKSAMLRAAMGDEVIDHYVHAARWEIESLDRAVTDWDVMRGFERA